MLMNIEGKYPGMTEFFRIGVTSTQAQKKHAIRIATDQCVEQTINKDAKSASNSIQSGSHRNTENKYTKMAAFKCVKFRA